MKRVLFGIMACAILLASCEKGGDNKDKEQNLNVPEGSIGFTKDGKNIILSNCYYTDAVDGGALFKTDDPKIKNFSGQTRSKTKDTYQFIVKGSMTSGKARCSYSYLEGEEADLSVSWKMTEGKLVITDYTGTDLSGTFEGTLTKYEYKNGNDEATAVSSKVSGKFVNLPRR